MKVCNILISRERQDFKNIMQKYFGIGTHYRFGRGSTKSMLTIQYFFLREKINAARGSSDII